MARQQQLALGIPTTLQDKSKSKVGRRVVNLTTSQLKKQGRRVRGQSDKADTTITVQGSLGFENEPLKLGLDTERNRNGQYRIDSEKQTKNDTAQAIERNASRKAESDSIERQNQRMTHRQKMEAQHGKDGTVRTGSSVRVLNRIALYEVGHNLNGGGTKPEVRDAAQWQSEFKTKGNRAGTTIATSYNNRDHSQGPKGRK